MASDTKRPPRGLLRLMLRLPIWIYRLRLGWLLGNRFLLLTHVGRKTGLPHQTVVEVVDHSRTGDRYLIASGWGKKSDWFRNIQKTPEVRVQVGRRSIQAHATILHVAEAAEVLLNYARQHPAAFRELAKFMMGERLGVTKEDCNRLAQSIPLVALRRSEQTAQDAIELGTSPVRSPRPGRGVPV
jgi:deazaflavin-dependent oxidoreductase (nitroreductase family)